MISTTWFMLLTVSLGQMQDEFHEDFRGDLHPGLNRFGPNMERAIHGDSGGLRIALPAERENLDAVGIETRFRVSGDFELTLAYELLDVKQPESGMGSGLKIWTKVDGGEFQAVTLGHMLSPQGENVFEAILATGDAPAERQFERMRVATTAKRGQLRLIRTGQELLFLAAENKAGDSQELLRTAVGAGDLTGLRFSAVTSGAKSALTVRLVDLQIRADALPGKPAAPPRRWPWKPIGISLAVVAVIGAAVWTACRRRR